RTDLDPWRPSVGGPFRYRWLSFADAVAVHGIFGRRSDAYDGQAQGRHAPSVREARSRRGGELRGRARSSRRRAGWVVAHTCEAGAGNGEGAGAGRVLGAPRGPWIT